MKVLLVDDEPAVLATTSMLLEELGHKVITTADAAQIVPLLEAERPDVVLQDVRMPGLDLEGLVRSVRTRADLARTPIVLFSASLDLGDLAQTLGIRDFVEKPFKPQELVGVLERAAPV